ncbi:hypothetical protein VST7929_00169 [Vibrio stylophorae]|uniref:Uncharacterized protein n=1 Tax=Vibrio stylophorae TaxID=659351 RepID=A0ABM8ZPX6_9VIBR|nr:hypothetical protein [Vibrio stylophorae]CAH0532351.1 hypothetical protein VST7929_00169 [Vibrio stylophorae]
MKKGIGIFTWIVALFFFLLTGCESVEENDPELSLVRIEVVSESIGEGQDAGSIRITGVGDFEQDRVIQLRALDEQLTLIKSQIILNEENWQQGVLVSVLAVDDTLMEGVHQGELEAVIQASGNTQRQYRQSLTFSILDNETAGLELAASAFTDKDIATYIFYLESQPMADVRVYLKAVSKNGDEISQSLTIQPENWRSYTNALSLNLPGAMGSFPVEYKVYVSTESQDPNFDQLSMIPMESKEISERLIQSIANGDYYLLIGEGGMFVSIPVVYQGENDINYQLIDPPNGLEMKTIDGVLTLWAAKHLEEQMIVQPVRISDGKAAIIVPINLHMVAKSSCDYDLGGKHLEVQGSKHCFLNGARLQWRGELYDSYPFKEKLSAEEFEVIQINDLNNPDRMINNSQFVGPAFKIMMGGDSVVASGAFILYSPDFEGVAVADDEYLALFEYIYATCGADGWRPVGKGMLGDKHLRARISNLYGPMRYVKIKGDPADLRLF